MKAHIKQLISSALETLRQDGTLPAGIEPRVVIEDTRDKSHGDLACNVAMTLAKAAKCKPRDLARAIVAVIPNSEQVGKVDIAGPGFINFTLNASAHHAVIGEVLRQGDEYGRSDRGQGRTIQVEFVSANPTGPLHVGHGRGAAYGATVADLLEAVGYTVHREYYVNDAGRQMDILGTSVYLRYLELNGEEINFPSNGYQGDYVWDIAATLHRKHGDAFARSSQAMFDGIAEDEPAGGDKEAHIDALINRAKELLGTQDYRHIFDLGLNTILDDIRQDLMEFGVEYQDWFSERSLVSSGAVERAIERLQATGHVYEKQGALWFRSTGFGDEKDRVVVRENGVTTYFASDIAYHMQKLERGYERVIDVWGADHHGYVPRVKAALEALGHDPSRLDVLLVQFAVLYSNGKKMQMSTRSGEFITLRELRHEVGNDAARFFYIMRKCEQHMDFDLDLAKSQSNDNPMYYIQYAHARVCSVLRQMQEKDMRHDIERGQAHLELLIEPHEHTLMTTLRRYPELIDTAASQHEPHQLAHYLRELASGLHTYYNAHTFLLDDHPGLRDARINLVIAVRQVLANGLRLLGVSAPVSM